MARPSLLDNQPELAEVIATAYIEGETNEQIAKALPGNVHKNTITSYRRDPRVKKIIEKLTNERISRITRKIDSQLEERLRDAKSMDTETLLKIRKELLPERIQITNGDKGNDLVEELWRRADGNPALAEALMQIGANQD